MSERMIKVVVVEDDAIMLEAFAEAVEADSDLGLSGAYASAEEFIAALEGSQPDVTIMDLNLPGMNGIECARFAKERWPAMQVLVCTVQDDDESLFSALCAGATGYLLKNATPAEVTEAIKSIAAGGSPMGPGIARRVLASFSAPRKVAKEMELLSEREREVLQRLAQGHRYKEIADGLHLSIETVRTHIRNLYNKLQVSSRTDALNKLYPR
jgi:DNA-binding NarL/FixJ family response regulator